MLMKNIQGKMLMKNIGDICLQHSSRRSVNTFIKNVIVSDLLRYNDSEVHVFTKSDNCISGIDGTGRLFITTYDINHLNVAMYQFRVFCELMMYVMSKGIPALFIVDDITFMDQYKCIRMLPIFEVPASNRKQRVVFACTQDLPFEAKQKFNNTIITENELNSCMYTIESHSDYTEEWLTLTDFSDSEVKEVVNTKRYKLDPNQAVSLLTTANGRIFVYPSGNTYVHDRTGTGSTTLLRNLIINELMYRHESEIYVFTQSTDLPQSSRLQVPYYNQLRYLQDFISNIHEYATPEKQLMVIFDDVPIQSISTLSWLRTPNPKINTIVLSQEALPDSYSKLFAYNVTNFVYEGNTTTRIVSSNNKVNVDLRLNYYTDEYFKEVVEQLSH